MSHTRAGDRSTGITREFQDALASYCVANPDFFGLYLAGCNLGLFPTAQVRTILGSWRRNLAARRRQLPLGAVPEGVTLLVDASVGGHHMTVWLPTTAALVKRGRHVGVAGGSPVPSPEVFRVLGAPGKGKWSYISLPETSPASELTPAFFDFRSPRVPIGGLMGFALEAMKTNLVRLQRCWEELLSGSIVEAVISTSPMGFWSSALVRAAQRLGRQIVYLQVGLPSRTFYRNYQADSAVVWSRMGREGLLGSGWNRCRFHMARNPSLLTEALRGEARRERRRQLGVTDGERLVLVLGQKALDVVFRVEGYLETCRLIGDGLTAASRTMRLRVLLRPHHGEAQPETEQILRSGGLKNLMVSAGTTLLEDIAAADVAIGMHSTALEEAYLSACPILQVVAAGLALEVDFQRVRAPLVRDVATLRDLVLDLGWNRQLLPLEDGCAVEEAIEELLAGRQIARTTQG